MLHNVVDLTDVLNKMITDGHTVTKEHIARLSPYMRKQILRFGRYDLDMEDLPKPLVPHLLAMVA